MNIPAFGPCLNYGLTWDTVSRIVTDPSTGRTVGEAFKNGYADKVLLPAGTQLYKFNEFPSLHGNWGGAEFAPVSPWWSPYEPFQHDPGWLAKERIAKHFRVSVREWGRITSAVKENWNSLSYLLVITLKHPTYAFFGGFSQMARIDPETKSRRAAGEGSAGYGVTQKYTSVGAQERIKQYGPQGSLAGGGTQFYIPNLRPTNILNWRVESLKDR